MLLAGHIGITLAVAKYAPRSIRDINNRLRMPRRIHTFTQPWTERLDDRALIVGSMLPDIVDKPLALFLAPTLVGHSLRNYGHTLVFAVAILAVAIALVALTKRQWPLTLAWASAGHLVLDMMWFSHQILFWPFITSDFSPRYIHEWGPHADPIYFGAEALGLIVICWIVFRLLRTRNFRTWLLTGRGA